MSSWETTKIALPLHWSGRFWGRRDCARQSDGSFYCVTGDCGRRFECAGAGGEPPATLAEFTFNAHEGLDFYDVSLVDGYNLPVAIEPVGGTYESGAGICQTCGCNKDLNEICPYELRVVYNGWTVGCKSACSALREARYCCAGEYNCSPHADWCAPGTKPCDPNTWPTNYASIFKQACPTSYSYAYDDPSSTFSCRGNPQVDYRVVFCP